MTSARRLLCLAAATAMAVGAVHAQPEGAQAPASRQQASSSVSRVRLRLVFPDAHMQKAPPAAVWLVPMGQAAAPAQPSPGHPKFQLVQRNKMFSPHLLIVPVGSVVSFPNQDPFFHNVFSLFDGKRFDLGLYEAGSTKDVTFSREGVSYVFCNIHPEMSAVVIALSTPLYAVVDENGEALLRDVPPGEYSLHAWAEGEPQELLNSLVRRVRVQGAEINLSDLKLPRSAPSSQHTNLYGQPYPRSAEQSY